MEETAGERHAIDEEVPDHKLQPMVLVIPKCMECDTCGALAVVLTFEKENEDSERYTGYEAYCQACWHKAVTEDEE